MRIALLRIVVFVVCTIMCVTACHAQVSKPGPVPQLFYEDPSTSQRTIGQLAIDNAGNVVSFTIQNSIDCGFGICGAVIYSIAPNGSLSWATSGVNYVASRVNQVAIASNNNIFFQDFGLEGIRALLPDGTVLPNWPVSLGAGINTSPSTLLIDPIDQTVLAKGGATSGFEPPSTRTASFHQDGTPKWAVTLPGGSAGTSGMVLGPNGGLYTFSDHTVLLDRSDGHVVCEFTSAGSDSFVPLAGGDGFAFSYTTTQVLRSDPDCVASPIYDWGQGRQGVVMGYDNGIVFAADFSLPGFSQPGRFLAMSKDGVLLWANDLFSPLAVPAVVNGLVYIVGIDANAVCCSQQKLFVLDENNGNIVASPEITAICPACTKVAVGPSGVYVGDLSSTKIYKIDGLVQSTSSEWRMQGVNPSRTNVAPVKGPETAPFFKPLATNVAGNLRRIALDGSLIVVDRLESNSFGTVSSYRVDGTQKWAATLAVGSFGIVDAAVGNDGTVYVSTVDTVTALNGNTGQSMWTFSSNPGSESSSLAVGNDGTIYFHNGGGTIGFLEALTAINPDGSLKWQEFPGFRGYTTSVFNTDQSLAYLINGKTCCGGLPIGNVSSFSTIDGHKVNDTPCDPRGDVYAFAQWGVLYSGNVNNDLLAFTPDIQGCTIVSADGMVAVGIASTTTTGRIITINNDGTLGGIDQHGNFLWRSTELLSQAFSSADAVIYAVAPLTNDLVALESEHGAVLWRKHFTDPISGQFLADDGNIYLTAGTNLFVSTPAPVTGTISISTNNANATFTVTGPANFTGTGTSFVYSNAPVGQYTIAYGNVDQHIAPPAETKTLVAGETLTFNGSYIPITLSACAANVAGCSHSLTFVVPAGFVGPISPQNISISSNAPSLGFVVTTSTSESTHWLSIAPTAAVAPASLDVIVSGNLPPGIYNGQITVSAPTAINSPEVISVSLVITSAPKKAPPHLVVVLFIGAAVSGAPADPNIGDGLKQLLNEIMTNPALPGVVGKVFSHKQFNDAIGFVSSNLGEQDALVLIGHSAGGDTARSFAQYISQASFASNHQRVRVKELVVIDPIDLSLGNLNQAFSPKPRPNGVDFVLGFYQRLGEPLFGIPPCGIFDVMSICGYRIVPADLEYRYDVPHTQIDNDARVHQNIMQTLTNIFSLK